MGADNKLDTVTINDPNDPNSDVTMGKYNVTVTVGPASETKRQLAAEQMMAFVNAVPQIAGNVMDLVADAQDWPNSIEFARRFKMMLPPGMVPADEMTPEMQAMQAQNMQAQQAQQKIQMLEIEAKLGQMSAKTSAENARAHLSVAQAYKAVLDAHSRADDVSQKAETAQLRTALDALDQHNTLAAEDRQHVLDVLKTLADTHATVASGNAANAQADATAAVAANPPADGDGQDSETSADASQETGNGATQ